MSRKQVSLLEADAGAPGAAGCREKLQPDGAMAQSGDVYRLGGSLLTTLLAIAMAGGALTGSATFTAAVSIWLWFTVLFANFAEAMAEGRSKAQANSLKGVKKRPSPANCAPAA